MLEILSSTFGRFVCFNDCLSPFPEFGSVRSVPGTSPMPIPWHDGSALRRPVFSGWFILSLTPGWTLSIEWRDGIINPDDWRKIFCLESLKWSASFRWSFGPSSAICIESTTIGKTRPTLIRVIFEPFLTIVDHLRPPLCHFWQFSCCLIIFCPIIFEKFWQFW